MDRRAALVNSSLPGGSSRGSAQIQEFIAEQPSAAPCFSFSLALRARLASPHDRQRLRAPSPPSTRGALAPSGAAIMAPSLGATDRADPQQQPRTPPRSGDYIALASPKLRSPAGSGSGALRYAESWAIPPRNRSAHLLYAGLPKAHAPGERRGVAPLTCPVPAPPHHSGKSRGNFPAQIGTARENWLSPSQNCAGRAHYS